MVTMNIHARRAGWILGLGLLAVFAAGCSDQGQALEATEDAGKEAGARVGETEDKSQDDLIPVEVETLGRGPIEAVLRFSTNLEAESEVQVYSQAARLVTELKVEEGRWVKKGDLLLRLQDEEQKSALKRIESQLKKARREYQRQQNLYEQQLISEQVMNESTYEVEQLEIALEDARRSLGYTEVRAPIAGTVTARHVNLGGTITVNQHLFDLVDFGTLVARVYVPEKELARLAAGQAARLYSTSLGGGPRSGVVDRISPVVDPKSGTVKVTVGIPRGQDLRPGMYVEVELVTDVHEDALLVPKRALVYDQNQAHVYRLSGEMTAERLGVAVLLEDREHIEPASGGLSSGDRIIIAGQAGLKDGAKVRLAGKEQARDEARPAGAGG